MIASSLVDGRALVQLVWVSLAAALVFVGAFALAVLGGARSAQAGRSGRGAASALYGVLGLLAALVCVAAVVVGIVVMAHKS